MRPDLGAQVWHLPADAGSTARAASFQHHMLDHLDAGHRQLDDLAPSHHASPPQRRGTVGALAEGVHDLLIRRRPPPPGHWRTRPARPPLAHPHHVGFDPARRTRAATERGRWRLLRRVVWPHWRVAAQVRVLCPQARQFRLQRTHLLAQHGHLPRSSS